MTPFSPETQDLQWELIDQGYLPELNARGMSNADGYLGPTTLRALKQREQDLLSMPAPAKPWWESRRGKGAAKLGLGLAVGAAAFFWSGAQHIDAAQAVEIIYAAGPQLDAAVEIGKKLLEVFGLLLAAFGFGQSSVGAIRAQGPLDPTLVARVGARDVRLPVRVRDRSGAVPPDRAGERGYWSGPRGPLDHD